MKTPICIFAAAILLPAAASAQNCHSFDTGQYPLGQVLTEQQRQSLSDASQPGTLHCSHDGKACSSQAADGTIYAWQADGTIHRKTFSLDNPASVPGWKGQINPQLASDLSRATCSSFQAQADDTGLSDSEYALKAAEQRTRDGKNYVTSIFGGGTAEDPLMIELSLGSE